MRSEVWASDVGSVMNSLEVRGMNWDLRRMESIEPRMLVRLNFSSWAFSLGE